jgi:MFS family permease
MMSRNAKRALRAVIAVRTLEALASSALLPFIVLWAHRDVGLVGVAAGALFVGQAVGEFGAGIIGGGLADRVGHRRVLIVSTLGTAASYGVLALVDAPLPAIALFLLSGIFESAFHPTAGAMVGDLVPEEELTHAFSLVRIGVNTGRIAGPLLGALVALSSLSLVFALSAALLVAAALLEWFALPADSRLQEHDSDPEPEIPPGTLRALRTDPGLALLVLGGGLIAITYTWWQADGLIVIRMQTELSTGTYAALFSLAAFVVVAGQLTVTRVLRRVPAGRILLLGGVLQGAGLGILAAAHWGVPVLVVAVLLMTCGEMVYAPTVSTIVTLRAGTQQRASYQAALSITEDIGMAVGPISGLATTRVLTAAGLWGAGAGLSVLAGLASSFGSARPPVTTSRQSDQLSRAGASPGDDVS